MQALAALLRAERGPDAYLRLPLAVRAMPDQDGVLNELAAYLTRFPVDELARILYIQGLGRAGKTQHAEEQVQKVLGRNDGNVLERLQQRLLDGQGLKGGRIRSEYACFPDSMIQNLGFWSHRITAPGGGVVEAITKIMHQDHCGREVAFYSRIRRAFPKLATISPDPLDLWQVTPNMVLLTMERVPGRSADSGSMSTDEVSAFVRNYQAIAEIPFGAVAGEIGERNTENGLSHGYLASALHMVHTPAGFTQTMEWTIRTVTERGYSQPVVDAVVQAMEHLMEHAFHTRVQPERHYSLLHGDMHRHNVLMSEERTVLIDWARCTTGPRGIDLVVLFRRFGYQRVQNMVQPLLPRHEPVPNILLAWAHILVSLELDLPGIKMEPEEHVFLPASKTILSATW
ncbi:MAG: aminoglycoside phosphotransferase family protein [Flavobacteriales bacterium]|jgi:hypothetical protein|nr:MAG: aminoglycoside phosphotransferase family protein [Flavobacteriales bacterium]